MLEMNKVSDINYFKKTIAYYNDEGSNLENVILPLHGKMAERMGLKEVNLEQINYLIQGMDVNGKPLIQGAGKNRKGAIDFTFSLTKDLSLAYSMADDANKELMDKLVEKAIHSTMKYKEEHLTMSKRKDDTQERKQASEIMYMFFQHYEARNNNDPQVHYHLLDINLCSNKDGEISSQDQQKAFEHKKMLGAYFRNTVYEEFQKNGFNFERHPEQKDFLKLKGIDIELMEKTSTRKHEINEYLEKNHLEKTHKNIKKAVLTTRRNKQHLETDELFKAWDDFYVAQGIDKNKVFSNLKKQTQTNSKEILRDKQIKTELMENVSVVKKSNIIEKYINAYAGTMTNKEILEKVENDINNGEFVQLSKTANARPTEGQLDFLDAIRHKIPDDVYEKINLDSGEELRNILNEYSGSELDKYNLANETLFTTREVIDTEMFIAKKALNYSNENHKLDNSLIVEKIKEINTELQTKLNNPNACLSEEQVNMVYHCLGTEKSISVVNGAPGSGKTAALKAIVRGFEEKGFDVIGSALSNRAKNGLGKDAVIEDCRNLARLSMDLFHKDENKRLVLNEKSVVIVDEAGQIDTITLGKILKVSNGAKIILVGDYLQLPSVSQGNMFGYLREQLGCAEVKQINRQRQRTLENGTIEDGKMFYTDKKTGISHNVVDMFGIGKIAEALSVYKEQDKLKTFENNEDKYKWLAERYSSIKEDPVIPPLLIAAKSRN